MTRRKINSFIKEGYIFAYTSEGRIYSKTSSGNAVFIADGHITKLDAGDLSDLQLCHPDMVNVIREYVGSSVGVLLPDLVPSPPPFPVEYEKLKANVELAKHYLRSAMGEEDFLLAELGACEGSVDLDIYNVLLTAPSMDQCSGFQIRNFYCSKADWYVYNQFSRRWISKEPKLAQFPSIAWNGRCMLSIFWKDGIPFSLSKSKFLLIMKEHLHPRGVG
jgi:hypothetical protein